MKIIASDYDGTLNHGGIDDTKRNAIKRWRKAGNLFGIVSGRGTADLLEIPKRNNFEYDFLLTCNGAVIINQNGEVLAESRCSGDLAKPLVEFLFSLGCKWVTVQTAFKCVINRNDEDCPDDEYRLETMPEIPYFNQINTALPDYEAAERVTQVVREKFGEVLNPLQNGTCIDIVSADMNKAKGLYKYLELVGAKYDDLITVGDNINDTHMIAEFRSYAMENGVQSIKDIADYETAGITELIEKELEA